jgi:hypothetical protein
MKKFLTILLAGVSTLAIAQKKSNLSRSIDDDGKTLSIRVTGTIDGKDINFERTFDVKGMSGEDRMALRDRVLDSIGSGNLNLPEPPLPRATPKPATPPAAPEPQPELGSSYSDDKDTHLVAVAEGYGNVPDQSQLQDFTKQIKVNQEVGEMYLRYTFSIKNEEFIFEKTVNIEEKTETQRQRIVEDFENEIGLPGKGIEM